LSRVARRALIGSIGLLVALGVIFIALRGCTLMPWARSESGKADVSVGVTRDFGKVLIKSERVKAGDGDSVMDVLEKVADVRTEYGGGFVSSIEGLRYSPAAGGGNDWFYYVNGVLAGVGAAEYRVRSGDHLWWDYHAWGKDNFVPAVVGAYPGPFARGYNGARNTTTVLYDDRLEGAARKIGGFLESQGASVTYRANLDEKTAAAAKGPAMVVCDTHKAAGTDWIRRLAVGSGTSVTFLNLQGDSLIPLDDSGKPGNTGEDVVAAVVATGSGMGDASPRWLVLCSGEKGASEAVRVLASGTQVLLQKVGVAIGASGAVYPLPR